MGARYDQLPDHKRQALRRHVKQVALHRILDRNAAWLFALPRQDLRARLLGGASLIALKAARP